MTKVNKVKFGLDEVHIAKITHGTDGNGNPTITYGTPFALKGAVNLTLDPEGDSADFYADNTKYFSDSANNGYSGSLEVALANEKFRTDILGETKDANGVLVENKDDVLSEFALGFRILGDTTERRYWYYECTPQRISTASGTIETAKNPQTDTINITATARITDGKVRAFIEDDGDNTATYNSFFSAVYETPVSA